MKCDQLVMMLLELIDGVVLPHFIVIHLGENDLGELSGLELLKKL